MELTYFYQPFSSNSNPLLPFSSSISTLFIRLHQQGKHFILHKDFLITFLSFISLSTYNPYPFLNIIFLTLVCPLLSPTKTMILGCKSSDITRQNIYKYHEKSILFRTRRYGYHNKLRTNNL